ncbi:MAG: exodeoxyribonuclease VII small subunit [Flammeovirgaceae bacterium]
MAKKDKTLNYTTAYAELEEIQQALESNEIPIDELSEQVKRANFLIQFCREKLRATEDEVQGILEANRGE